MNILENASKPRILVVEDDDLLQGLLCDILESEGYEVDKADHGDSALEKISSTRYNVILLDLVFRKKYVQGIEVLRRVQALHPQLPVIVISGRASDEVVLQTVFTGGFSFLLKPVRDLNNLLTLIENALMKDKLTGGLSKTATPHGEYVRVKGITSDMHTYVKQYIQYFEEYLLQFKGARVSIHFEREFDDIKVRLESDLDKEQIHKWFHEYLSFAEQNLPLSPIFETSVSPQNAVVSAGELERQVKSFTENVARSFWRSPVAQSEKNATESLEFYINSRKIVNNLNARVDGRSGVAFVKAADTAVFEATVLIAENRTLEALTTLNNFAEHFGLKEVLKDIVLIQNRFNRVIDDRMKNIVSLEYFYQELNNIHNALMWDVMPAIEKLSAPQLAAATH